MGMLPTCPPREDPWWLPKYLHVLFQMLTQECKYSLSKENTNYGFLCLINAYLNTNAWHSQLIQNLLNMCLNCNYDIKHVRSHINMACAIMRSPSLKEPITFLLVSGNFSIIYMPLFSFYNLLLFCIERKTILSVPNYFPSILGHKV